MKISKSKLIKMNACIAGLERFIEQTNNTDKQVDVASLVGGRNTYGDFLWLASKTLTNERIVRFACDCALLNIEKIKPYTLEYDLIVDFLYHPSKAAADAYAYAYAAYADASAASAASAAASAYAAADCAAADAANVSPDAKQKVDQLLRDMFEEITDGGEG